VDGSAILKASTTVVMTKTTTTTTSIDIINCILVVKGARAETTLHPLVREETFPPR
jgi:hypothetical protein